MEGVPNHESPAHKFPRVGEIYKRQHDRHEYVVEEVLVDTTIVLVRKGFEGDKIYISKEDLHKKFKIKE